MKALRQLGLCAAIFAGLLFLYVGAYLGIYKNDLGRNIFGNTYQARGVADIAHRIAAHFFAPLRRMEYWHNEAQLKKYLVGEWASADGNAGAQFGPDMSTAISGFSVLGFQDDSKCSTNWSYWGSADYGDTAVPTLTISSSLTNRSLEVVTIDMSRDEIRVNLLGLGLRGGAVLRKKVP